MSTNKKNSCQYAQLTDVGCVRDLNEDSIFCAESLWLVADGMGGHACGEVASQLAAEQIPLHFEALDSLSSAIMNAHDEIIEAGKNGIGQPGMGTTVVALACRNEEFEVAWVGDSRAYLWDGKRGKLTQLSEDHSLIVRLINSGLISEEEARNHPQRHMITQCLGTLEIDKLHVDTHQGKWRPNQQILLCSDGLTDEISDDEIAEVMAAEINISQKLDLLVNLAKKAGGKDNISLIIVDSPVTAKQGLLEKLSSLFSS